MSSQPPPHQPLTIRREDIEEDEDLRLQPHRPKEPVTEFVPAEETESSNSDSDLAVKTSVLCKNCRCFCSWLEANAGTPNQMSSIFDHAMEHYKTGVELEQSATRGCHLCTIIWESLVENNGLHPERRQDEARRGRNLTLRIIILFKDHVSWQWNSWHLLIATLTVSDSLEANELRGKVNIKARRGNDPTAASTNLSTESSSHWKVLLGWLNECNTSHVNCQRHNLITRSAPTRLLYVGPGTVNPRVVETRRDSSFKEYLTLSYCWGGIREVTLTKSSYSELTSGVSIQRLPKTIRDAIRVTQRLGMSWLWVDSLCIIQDSKEDWGREARSMASVYENSWLTIAAVSAKNSLGGLFGKRDPLIYERCQLFRDAKGTNWYAFTSEPSNVHEKLFHKLPLHARGWVVQERLLSRRTLNFGHALFWECRTKFYDDRGLTGFWVNVKEPFSKLFNGQLNLPSLEDRISFMSQWYDHVLKPFSKAALTVKSDRFTAVSGVIKAVERQTGWSNAAGLWLPVMIYELLWTRLIDSIPTEPRPLHSGPTWSWVSIDGSVSHPEPCCGTTGSQLLAAIDHLRVDPVQRRVDRSVIRRAIPYQVHLDCILIQFEEIRCGDELDEIHGLTATAISSGSTTKSIDGNLHPDIYPLPPGPYCFTPVWWTQKAYAYGLLLIPSGEVKGAFERIGVFMARSHLQEANDPTFGGERRKIVLT